MKLYIQIIDNQPVNHPILEDNLLMFYTAEDLANNPQYAPFVRVAQPTPKPYERPATCVYEKVDGVYTDVWTAEPMTAEEILEKQTQVKLEWQEAGGYASWEFNENTCSFDPPEPYPSDDKVYTWSEETLTWVEVDN